MQRLPDSLVDEPCRQLAAAMPASTETVTLSLSE
jgi:hypothetical protein